MDRAAAIELLASHHTFPSDHLFRLIVRAEPTDIEAVLAATALFLDLLDVADRTVQVPSSKGRWMSLRITLPCTSAEQVIDLYTHFRGLPQVVQCL